MQECTLFCIFLLAGTYKWFNLCSCLTQQEHSTFTHSPSVGWGRESEKWQNSWVRIKIVGKSNRTYKKWQTVMKMKECTKQAMQFLTTHWLMTSAVGHLPLASTPQFIHWVWLCMVWDSSWVIWGQLSHLCPLSSSCTPPVCPLVGQ